MKDIVDIYDVYFYADDALLYNGKSLSKDQVMNVIRLNLQNEKNKIKRKDYNSSSVYSCIFKNYQIDVHFPYADQLNNIKYIAEFERKIENQKKRNKNRIKIVSLALILSIDGAFLLKKPISNFVSGINGKLTDKVQDLDDELLIHSGHGEVIYEKSVSPSVDHDCVFDSDKNISIEDRISKYCSDNDLDYMKDKVLEKWDYLYNNDMKSADEINLKKISKEHNKEVKQKIKTR